MILPILRPYFLYKHSCILNYPYFHVYKGTEYSCGLVLISTLLGISVSAIFVLAGHFFTHFLRMEILAFFLIFEESCIEELVFYRDFLICHFQIFVILKIEWALGAQCLNNLSLCWFELNCQYLADLPLPPVIKTQYLALMSYLNAPPRTKCCKKKQYVVALGTVHSEFDYFRQSMLSKFEKYSIIFFLWIFDIKLYLTIIQEY